MDKVFISNQIKLEILKMCGVTTAKAYNLPGDVRLDELYSLPDEKFLRLLEFKLQEIATYYNTGKIITKGDLQSGTTVLNCLKLVFA